jgi:hypothetical protein
VELTVSSRARVRSRSADIPTIVPRTGPDGGH